MRARSWMAALALIGGTSILIGRGLSAQAPGTAQEQSPAKEAKSSQEKPSPRAEKPSDKADATPGKRKYSSSQYPTINIELAVAGLGTQGCEVEIKPANAACKFRPAPTKHISSDGYARMELRDVELRGADKTCTLAITIREPGQPPHTIYRGFRPGSSKPGTVPSFNCYVSSRITGVDTKTTRK